MLLISSDKVVVETGNCSSVLPSQRQFSFSHDGLRLKAQFTCVLDLTPASRLLFGDSSGFFIRVSRGRMRSCQFCREFHLNI